MNYKEMISNRQGISLIVLFIIGEGGIFIQAASAKNDLWLAFILAVIFSLPLVLLFARLHVLFPEKDIYDIIENCFGRYLGKALIIMFLWYCFESALGTMEDLGFFVRTNIFPETPDLAIIIPFMLICAYAVKQGIEVLGRCGELFLIVPIVLVLLVFLLLIPQMEFNNSTPVLYQGYKPVIKGAFLTWGFPLVFISGFTTVFALSKEKNSAYKIYFGGFLIGAAILFVMYMTVLLVLGAYHTEVLYYPTYVVVSMINIGGFLQRLDIIAAIVYMIGIFAQGGIFLLGACKGFARLFSFPDYRFIIWPVTLLIINICSYEHESIMYFFEYAIDTWPYYILPFEVFLPVLIWIVAEIRVRRAKKRV